jgi:hypothetical protein
MVYTGVLCVGHLPEILTFVSACNAQPPVGAVGVMQLSEPLLWFILRVVDKESALEEFNRMGGVRVCINHSILQNLEMFVNEQMVLTSVTPENMK